MRGVWRLGPDRNVAVVGTKSGTDAVALASQLLRKGLVFSAVAGLVWRGLMAAENAAGGGGRTFLGAIRAGMIYHAHPAGAYHEARWSSRPGKVPSPRSHSLEVGATYAIRPSVRAWKFDLSLRLRGRRQKRSQLGRLGGLGWHSVEGESVAHASICGE